MTSHAQPPSIEVAIEPKPIADLTIEKRGAERTK
jgi:hypothetical protein